jgi:hypothetical protein
MSSRTIINLLVIIILAFTIKGFFVLREITDTIEKDQTQQQVVTQDIGMAFDWYGLTVVDTIVKYKHNIIKSDELVAKLTEGKKQKQELLERYYTTSTNEEKQFIQSLKDSDTKVDVFVDKVIAQSKISKPVKDTAVITEMYSLTQPAVDTINTIINVKTQKSIEIKAHLYENISMFDKFLKAAAVLAVAIGISGNLPKREEIP